MPAENAGLTAKQKNTALRIANVPEAEFEEAIERDQSPSVTEMAERAVRRMGELLRGILAAKK